MYHSATKAIRLALKKKGWSITELGRRAGLTRSQVSHIYNETRKCPVSQIEKILVALNFHEEKIEELVIEYAAFYELAQNHKDFKFLTLIRKYKARVILEPALHFEGLKADGVIELEYKNKQFIIALSVKRRQSVRCYKRVLRTIRRRPFSYDFTLSMYELCEDLDINVSEMLGLLEYLLIGQLKYKELNELTNSITINRETLEKLITGFFDDDFSQPGLIYMNGDSMDVDYGPTTNEIFQSFKDYTKDLMSDLKKHNAKELKLYPKLFRAIKEEITQYL